MPRALSLVSSSYSWAHAPATTNEKVTPIEKQWGQTRPRRILRWLEHHNLQRHLAYARVWLRGNPQDREKAERYLHRVVARLQRAAA